MALQTTLTLYPTVTKVGLEVKGSPGLANWFSGEHHTTVVTDDDRILTVRDNTPIKEGVKRFIRVKQ